MSSPSGNTRLKNKRVHDQLSSNSESCFSNALQLNIDPKTGKKFRYSKKLDEWELSKFIMVESLYSRSFKNSLENYVQIFYNPTEYSEEKNRAELVKLISVESILYNTSFINSLTIYIRTAHYPEYKPIPRKTIIPEIKKQFLEYQNQIIENFKSLSSKVTLAFDIINTDSEGEAILCLTAHWIDDNYIMQKIILAYQKRYLTDDIHDVGLIIAMIGEYSRRYCLGNKIFSISFYRETPNELAVKELKHKYVTCACHILNSIVKDGITHFEPELRKIREAMRYMMICRSTENEFYKKCLAQNHKAKYLTTDIPTRWNSTYEMLVLAFMCKPILTEAYNESLDYEEKDELNNINWDICEDIVKFLGQFCFAAAHFSSSNHPTCNSILIYLNDIASLFFKFKDKPFFSNIIPNMRAIFIKHFIPVPPIYLLGVLLDPMMKLQHIELCLKILYQNLELNYSEEDLSSHKNDLLKLANEIYSDYEVKIERTQPPVPPASSSSSKRFPGCEFWEKHVVMSNESKRSNFNELSFYLEQQYDIDESDFDLLVWWKENARKFPVLSRMARDVLAVPVSTISISRVYSQGELVEIGEKSYLMGNSSVERLECLKDWVRVERGIQGLPEIDSEFLDAFMDLDPSFNEKCNMSDDDDDDNDDNDDEEDDDDDDNDNDDKDDDDDDNDDDAEEEPSTNKQ